MKKRNEQILSKQKTDLRLGSSTQAIVDDAEAVNQTVPDYIRSILSSVRGYRFADVSNGGDRVNRERSDGTP